MSQTWEYQVRLRLDGAHAETVRKEPDADALAELRTILAAHNAKLKCQYDAFAGYVAEAEARGVEHFPLYAWTKATIENPAKKDKYLKAFTCYVNGDEVYAKDKADALEVALKPLVGGGIVTALSKHDTNPANNPQPPERYRQ